MTVGIDSLPNEMLVEIFTNLDLRGLLNAGNTCKRWHQIRSDKRVNEVFQRFELSGTKVTIPYYRTIYEGATFGYCSFGPQPQLGTFKNTFTLIKNGEKWLIEDSFTDDPALPKKGLEVDGVKSWIRKLLSGKECTRLQIISGVFCESFNPTQKFSINPPE